MGPIGACRELSYGGPKNVFKLILSPTKQNILLFEIFFCLIEEIFAALKKNVIKLIKNLVAFKKNIFVEKKNSLIGIYIK